jgi:hypothetical protein
LSQAEIAIVTREWIPSTWTGLLDRLTVKRVPLLAEAGVLYVDDDEKGLPAPPWKSNLSLIDSINNKIDPEELDSSTVAWIKAKTKHWTKEHLEHENEEEDLLPPPTPTQSHLSEDTVKNMVTKWLDETNQDTLDEWETEGHLIKHVHNPEDPWRPSPQPVALTELLLHDDVVNLSGQDEKEYEVLVKKHSAVFNKFEINNKNPMRCTFSLREEKRKKR